MEKIEILGLVLVCPLLIFAVGIICYGMWMICTEGYWWIPCIVVAFIIGMVILQINK